MQAGHRMIQRSTVRYDHSAVKQKGCPNVSDVQSGRFGNEMLGCLLKQLRKEKDSEAKMAKC